MKKLFAIIVIVSLLVGFSMGWLSGNMSILNACLIIAAVSAGGFLLLCGPADGSIK